MSLLNWFVWLPTRAYSATPLSYSRRAMRRKRKPFARCGSDGFIGLHRDWCRAWEQSRPLGGHECALEEKLSVVLVLKKRERANASR
jgi:hypothetical protein